MSSTVAAAAAEVLPLGRGQKGYASTGALLGAVVDAVDRRGSSPQCGETLRYGTSAAVDGASTGPSALQLQPLLTAVGGNGQRRSRQFRDSHWKRSGRCCRLRVRLSWHGFLKWCRAERGQMKSGIQLYRDQCCVSLVQYCTRHQSLGQMMYYGINLW